MVRASDHSGAAASVSSWSCMRSGIDAAWRQELQAQIVRQADAFIQTQGFSDWLLRLLQAD